MQYSHELLSNPTRRINERDVYAYTYGYPLVNGYKATMAELGDSLLNLISFRRGNKTTPFFLIDQQNQIVRKHMNEPENITTPFAFTQLMPPTSNEVQPANGLLQVTMESAWVGSINKAGAYFNLHFILARMNAMYGKPAFDFYLEGVDHALNLYEQYLAETDNFNPTALVLIQQLMAERPIVAADDHAELMPKLYEADLTDYFAMVQAIEVVAHPNIYFKKPKMSISDQLSWKYSTDVLKNSNHANFEARIQGQEHFGAMLIGLLDRTIGGKVLDALEAEEQS